MTFALQSDSYEKAPSSRPRPSLTHSSAACAAVAIFAFVDAALLAGCHIRSPRASSGYTNGSDFPQSNLSYADYLDWKRMNTVFTSLSRIRATARR
jgi:hypothetical protein